MAYSIRYGSDVHAKKLHSKKWLWVLVLLAAVSCRIFVPALSMELREAIFGSGSLFSEGPDKVRDAVAVFYEELIVP